MKKLYLVFLIFISSLGLSCVEIIEPVLLPPCQINETGSVLIWHPYYLGDPETDPPLIYYKLVFSDLSEGYFYIGALDQGWSEWSNVPAGPASLYIEKTYLLNNGGTLIETEIMYFDINICSPQTELTISY